LLLVHLNQTI